MLLHFLHTHNYIQLYISHYPHARSRELTDQQPRAQVAWNTFWTTLACGRAAHRASYEQKKVRVPHRNPDHRHLRTKQPIAKCSNEQSGQPSRNQRPKSRTSLPDPQDPIISQARTLFHANAAGQEQISVCQPAALPSLSRSRDGQSAGFASVETRSTQKFTAKALNKFNELAEIFLSKITSLFRT